MICETCWTSAGRLQAAGDPRSQADIYHEILDRRADNHHRDEEEARLLREIEAAIRAADWSIRVSAVYPLLLALDRLRGGGRDFGAPQEGAP